MKRYEMIKDKNYFSYIIKNGKYNKDKNYVIYYVKNNKKDFPQFGIAIKNKIGKAVVRNKLKRQTRFVIENNKKLFKKDKDYIIMIREGLKEASFKEIDTSIKMIMKGIEENEKK